MTVTPFGRRKPLVSIDFTGDQRSLATAVWPQLRDHLVRWHMTGAAELRDCGGVVVDPLGLHRVEDVLGLTMNVFDPDLAVAAAKQYLR